MHGDGLASILARFGLFAEVEAPRDDCEAIAEALSANRWLLTEDPPFAQIRHRMDERRVEVVATGPTYAIWDDLKVRGYRWSRGVGDVGKCWTLLCPYHSALMEIAWLRHRLHAQGGSPDAPTSTQWISPLVSIKVELERVGYIVPGRMRKTGRSGYSNHR